MLVYSDGDNATGGTAAGAVTFMPHLILWLGMGSPNKSRAATKDNLSSSTYDLGNHHIGPHHPVILPLGGLF